MQRFLNSKKLEQGFQFNKRFVHLRAGRCATWFEDIQCWCTHSVARVHIRVPQTKCAARHATCRTWLWWSSWVLTIWIALGAWFQNKRPESHLRGNKEAFDGLKHFCHMQLLDYVFVCSLNVVFVSLFARLDAKDVNMHPNHEYNCSGFKILTCSLRLVVTNGGSCILVVKMTGFDRANRNPTPSNVILFIYFYFIFGVFLPPSFFSRLVYRFCRISFPGGFGTWGRDFVAIAQLFAAFMVLGGFGYCPAFEGVFMLQSCANCDLPAPWLLFSSPVGSWSLTTRTALLWCKHNQVRPSPWLPLTLTNHSSSVVVCCVLERLWVSGCRGPLG